MNQINKNGILKVVIVDDHEIFRQGLRVLIKGFENLSVVGSLTDGKQLKIFLTKQIPDIIIMDINMPFIDGITASQYVKEHYPDIKIIALTMYSDSFTIDRAFKAGASAFLTKSITRQVFCEALQHVIKGIPYISADAAINYTMEQLKPNMDSNKFPGKKWTNLNEKLAIDLNVSQRDIEIVRYISKGCTSAEIVRLQSKVDFLLESASCLI